jgi:hypothetical protein
MAGLVAGKAQEWVRELTLYFENFCFFFNSLLEVQEGNSLPTVGWQVSKICLDKSGQASSTDPKLGTEAGSPHAGS